MKIAIVIEHFDPTRGGAEQLTVWLARQLAAAGHEVHVVCHDVASRINRYRAATQRASHDADRSLHAHGVHPDDDALPPELKIHRLRGFKLSSGIGFRLFGKRAAAWCRRHRPDIVHSMTVAFPGDIYHPHAGVYAAMQAQAIASRSTASSAMWKQLMLRLSSKQRTLLALERRAARVGEKGGPRRILSISPMMSREFATHYRVPDDKLVLLPNPQMRRQSPESPTARQGREWFRGHYGLSNDDRVAVFVGHDFRRKGLRYAIQAIGATKSNWKLLVVGLGKVREYFEMAAAAGLGDRVKFIGPTRQMEDIYAASDALLLPTFYDSFGLVVVEAFSHGLPVISTEFLGAAYLVRESGAGTIVASPKDVPAMAAALDALPPFASKDQQDLAARAIRASEGMTADIYMTRLTELYRSLVRNTHNT